MVFRHRQTSNCENLADKGKDTEWKVILLTEQSLEVYNLLSELKTP
jgi:hypothetical protein